MTVSEMAEKLNLKIACGKAEKEVAGLYVGDLLSRVMSRAPVNSAWITIMNNVNTVAVSALADTACVLLCESVKPDPVALEKAVEKGVTIVASDLSAAELCVAIDALLK